MPDWEDCVSLEGFAFKPIIEPTDTSRFAPPNDSLFFVCGSPPGAKKSKQKKAPPDIRPRLRRGSLTPSSLQGRAAKGHPWPIASLAASMPLNPLRNDSVRPPEGGVWSCLKALYSFPDGSHAPRGNPSRDAPRHRAAGSAKHAMDAERRKQHSHAQGGNDQVES